MRLFRVKYLPKIPEINRHNLQSNLNRFHVLFYPFQLLKPVKYIGKSIQDCETDINRKFLTFGHQTLTVILWYFSLKCIRVKNVWAVYSARRLNSRSCQWIVNKLYFFDILKSFLYCRIYSSRTVFFASSSGAPWDSTRTRIFTNK